MTIRSALIAMASLCLPATVAHAQSAYHPTDADVGWESPLCGALTDAAFTGYCLGPAGRLDITLYEFQLRRASDGALVTIASGARTFDFAGVAANTEIGQFASSIRVPYGTYDALGFVMGLNTVFTGQTNGGAAGDCAITATDFSTSLAAAAPRQIDMRALGLDYDTSAVILPPGDRLQGIDDEASGLPITVAAGSTVNFSMSVSAGKGVWYHYSGGVCDGAGPYGPRVRTGLTVS